MAHPKGSSGFCFPWGSGEVWCGGEGRKRVRKGIGLCWQDWKAFKTLPHVCIMDFSFSLFCKTVSSSKKEQWPNNSCMGNWVLSVFAGQCLSAIIQV